ncbi:MutS-related protein [Chitinophaga sp. 22321]|uniref:DNA mismatch repair protein n=1 Tax=Chitinophaga hostae TaxID=2831022 RepID=A0ABS5J9D8_9BACT|nr:DNA mismatch repair protein [Chitinophaga hostae]MBS0031835.1 DNA mismatch repair protein [Chitinophaga hostae]
MSFFADKQTLDDLNISGKYNHKSVYRMFDTVTTGGGRKLLEQMFRQPLTDHAAINDRSSIFQYFGRNAVTFPFGTEAFEVVENYLSSGISGSMPATAWNIISVRLLKTVIRDTRYDLLVTGVGKTIALLKVFREFICQLAASGAYSPVQAHIEKIREIFNDKRLQWLNDAQDVAQISPLRLIRYDYLLRTACQNEMKTLVDIIYEFDVYIAVAAVGRTKHFCYARAAPKHKNVINISGLFHPSLEKPVSNHISFQQECNVAFLTGANMAGKSTFMKSFGIAVYLSHMGFPVAAEKMEFSVKDGLFSTINVPDSLEHGYSHFYAEVLRVKSVAEQVGASKDLVVLFDELFKGTNVKDAFDATLAITAAFSENTNCFFIISSHIIEVGEALKERGGSYQFLYLPTVMEGNVPRYTYQLQPGITADRHGMVIIENEGLIGLIRKRE